MSEQGDTAARQMTAELQGMVDNFATRRPQEIADYQTGKRPQVVARTETAPDARAAPVTSIGAAAVAQRLEALTKQAADLAKQAELLATALAGPEKQAGGPVRDNRPKPEHLFGRQLMGLDEVGQQLDAIHSAIERAARSLT